MQYAEPTGLSPIPSVCLEKCSTIPEATQERAWMEDMRELYAACSIINLSCSSELLKQKLDKDSK